jgi:hypothetical protein
MCARCYAAALGVAIIGGPIGATVALCYLGACGAAILWRYRTTRIDP